MSGGDALLEAEFEAGLLQSTYITGYCSTAYTAVLIYDYFLTLPDEISLFWNAPSKAPSGTILFALNRFVALGLIITSHVASDPVTYTFAGGIGHSCACSHSTELVSICAYILASRSPACYELLLLLSRSCSLASDLIVLIVTLYYVWPRSSAARSLLSKGSISHALLKNGISYFAVLGLINALEIILYLTTDENFVNVFLSPASTLVVARFLLEIRAAVYRPNSALGTETLGTDTELTSTDGGAESRMWQSLEFAKKLESAENPEDTFASTEDDEAEYEMGSRQGRV
ncbi:hypothetical protein EVJ58_g3998 [Rhodofomes roseus]|uniref:DUF6533 domain-containing protein n=1 Tax=Rhodofomes roseus TaxID=34475 RepID=A0A4Y9YKT0_9APHY|nr:hypothetical protein EVJ58_g3998 [Rhodofomes roseus]